MLKNVKKFIRVKGRVIPILKKHTLTNKKYFLNDKALEKALRYKPKSMKKPDKFLDQYAFRYSKSKTDPRTVYYDLIDKKNLEKKVGYYKFDKGKAGKKHKYMHLNYASVSQEERGKGLSAKLMKRVSDALKKTKNRHFMRSGQIINPRQIKVREAYNSRFIVRDAHGKSHLIPSQQAIEILSNKNKYYYSRIKASTRAGTSSFNQKMKNQAKPWNIEAHKAITKKPLADVRAERPTRPTVLKPAPADQAIHTNLIGRDRHRQPFIQIQPVGDPLMRLKSRTIDDLNRMTFNRHPTGYRYAYNLPTVSALFPMDKNMPKIDKGIRNLLRKAETTAVGRATSSDQIGRIGFDYDSEKITTMRNFRKEYVQNPYRLERIQLVNRRAGENVNGLPKLNEADFRYRNKHVTLRQQRAVDKQFIAMLPKEKKFPTGKYGPLSDGTKQIGELAQRILRRLNAKPLKISSFRHQEIIHGKDPKIDRLFGIKPPEKETLYRRRYYEFSPPKSVVKSEGLKGQFAQRSTITVEQNRKRKQAIHITDIDIDPRGKLLGGYGLTDYAQNPLEQLAERFKKANKKFIRSNNKGITIEEVNLREERVI